MSAHVSSPSSFSSRTHLNPDGATLQTPFSSFLFPALLFVCCTLPDPVSRVAAPPPARRPVSLLVSILVMYFHIRQCIIRLVTRCAYIFFFLFGRSFIFWFDILTHFLAPAGRCRGPWFEKPETRSASSRKYRIGCCRRLRLDPLL